MHPKVLSTEAWKVVRSLVRGGLLDDWTLAGGTGLALQLGHRVSEDLDFFRPQAFDGEALLGQLAGVGQVVVQDRGPSTLHALVSRLRLSFLALQAPLLFPGLPYRGLILADTRDIAAMKLVAIGGRGSRKDFIDLHAYLEAGGDLEAALGFLEQRYLGVDFNRYHILKSLTWFADAETEPMPRMLRSTTWEEVKAVIVAAAQGLGP